MRLEGLCAASLFFTMLASFAPYPGMMYTNVLSVLGISIAQMNKARSVLYFIVLMGFSILFDFIQMIIDGNSLYYSTGAGVWSLLCAIVVFLMKFCIVYCCYQLFLMLGGTLSFSSLFGAPDDSA